MILKGLTFSELNADTLFIFVFCYTNNINFDNLYILYKLSKNVFWAYINTLSPIMKLTNKKMAKISLSVQNLLKYMNNNSVTLSEEEKHIYRILRLYIIDIFTDGVKCITFDKIKNKYFDIIDYSNNRITNVLISKNVLSNMNALVDKNTLYYKNSRINYILEKYHSTLKVSEVRKYTLKGIESIVDSIDKGY